MTGVLDGEMLPRGAEIEDVEKVLYGGVQEIIIKKEGVLININIGAGEETAVIIKYSYEEA